MGTKMKGDKSPESNKSRKNITVKKSADRFHFLKWGKYKKKYII